jgi:hypothetical protein
MRKTELTVDRLVYREKCSVVTRLLFKSKKEYFSNKSSELGNDQKQLQRFTNNLMGKTNEVVLPMHENSLDLSNNFNTFFINKIGTIRNDLSSSTRFCSDKCDALTVLSPASIEEVRKIVMKSASKSCELDPIPTFLLKQSMDGVLPVITDIVNASLTELTVPQSFRLLYLFLKNRVWTRRYLRTIVQY